MSIDNNKKREDFTYREWLIGMLASNPEIVKREYKYKDDTMDFTRHCPHLTVLFDFADEIIKQLNKR